MGDSLRGGRGVVLGLAWLLVPLLALASPAGVAHAADPADPAVTEPTVCVTGVNDLGQLYQVDCHDTNAPVPLFCLVPFDTYIDGEDRTDRYEIVACPTDPTHTDPPNCLDREISTGFQQWSSRPVLCTRLADPPPEKAVTLAFVAPPDALHYRHPQTLTFTTTDPHGVPLPDVPLEAVTIDTVTQASRTVPVHTDGTGSGTVSVLGYPHRTEVVLRTTDRLHDFDAGVEHQFRVRPAVTARTVRIGGRVALVGAVRPARTGTAALQRLRDRRWVRVTVRPVTRTGTARFPHPRSGAYRVCSRGTEDYARSCSPVLRVR